MLTKLALSMMTLSLGAVAAIPATIDLQKDGATETSQAAVKQYPRLKMMKDEYGETIPSNWPQISDNEWMAVPDDPKSPRFLKAILGKATPDPERALATTARRAAIQPVDVQTREIETWGFITDGGKAWVSAAHANGAGVEQSIISLTFYSQGRSGYISELYVIPKSNYRDWGGVMFMLDLSGVSAFLEGLPANFAENARSANNSEQAEIFAGLVDITVTRTAMETQQAMQSTLSTMQAINRDLQTRGDCLMSSNCTYSQNGGPGTGTATYGPGE